MYSWSLDPGGEGLFLLLVRCVLTVPLFDSPGVLLLLLLLLLLLFLFLFQETVGTRRFRPSIKASQATCLRRGQFSCDASTGGWI